MQVTYGYAKWIYVSDKQLVLVWAAYVGARFQAE